MLQLPSLSYAISLCVTGDLLGQAYTQPPPADVHAIDCFPLVQEEGKPCQKLADSHSTPALACSGCPLGCLHVQSGRVDRVNADVLVRLAVANRAHVLGEIDAHLLEGLRADRHKHEQRCPLWQQVQAEHNLRRHCEPYTDGALPRSSLFVQPLPPPCFPSYDAVLGRDQRPYPDAPAIKVACKF